MNYDNLIPLGENFLVRRTDITDQTSGGIYLPDQAKLRAPEGFIAGFGKGKAPFTDETWKFGLEIGDHVMLTQFGGADLGDYAIIPSNAVLGLFHGTSLYPLGKNMLVRMDPRKEVEGSIVLPDFSKTTEVWGTVQRIGEDCTKVHRDDRVYILPTQGTHYREKGADYIIIHQEKVTLTETR
jgi:chaperonin GroES